MDWPEIPKTAIMFYMNDLHVRSDVWYKNIKLELSTDQINDIIRDMWYFNISEEEKEPYREMEKQDKIRHKCEVYNYILLNKRMGKFDADTIIHFYSEYVNDPYFQDLKGSLKTSI